MIPKLSVRRSFLTKVCGARLNSVNKWNGFLAFNAVCDLCVAVAKALSNEGIGVHVTPGKKNIRAVTKV